MSTHKEFAYKEIDEEGMETLQVIADANRFNEWMYQTISTQLQGNILEIGSGLGNISNYFLRDGHSICLSDLRENYRERLREQFSDKTNLIDIVNLDLVHPTFEQEYAQWIGYFDGVFALNVVEHIKDDLQAIANCRKLLKPGGRLVILVPAYQVLYNQFDEALEHYRRYTKSTLIKLFDDNQLEVQKSQYFNAAGIMGWVLSGAILKKKTIPAGQMQLYNRLVPLFKIADKVLMNQIGLSVIVEGVKQHK
ncbi:MAG: class I SAM-dependent methyltransferase [Bacteroidota bacterium]